MKHDYSKAPDAQAPKNTKELIEQRRDLHGRDALAEAGRMMQAARSRFVALLDKQGEGSGALAGMFRFLREKVGGPKSVLSDAELRLLQELYDRAHNSVVRIDGVLTAVLTPDEALLLAAEAQMLMTQLVNRYDYERITYEVEVILDISMGALAEVNHWWEENGYKMPDGEWKRRGKPDLAWNHGNATPKTADITEGDKVNLIPTPGYQVPGKGGQS